MLTKAIPLIKEYDMAPAGSLILCAVSGGADSICLLHFLDGLGRSAGFSVTAGHYNHRLRGAESDRDAAFVASWCAEHGISCILGEGDVAGRAAEDGTGIEETARAMRYAFLEQTALELGAARIATAHNADDNVETLLLHLIRGSGLQGLTGIPPRRGDIVRPLLTTSREEIEAYLSAHDIPHVEDSTNADTAYLRNKLRLEIIPLLRQLNPRLTESISATVKTLRADNDFLNARAAERAAMASWVEDDLVIDTGLIAGAPSAIAPRVARRLLEQMGNGSSRGSFAHLGAIVDLSRGGDPSGTLHLPDGLLVQRVYGELLFTAEQGPLPPFEPVPLKLDGKTELPDSPWRFFCRRVTVPANMEKNRHTFYLKRDMICGAVLLRPRKTGDSISLPGRGGKTIKKLLIDEKIPRRLRERVPILADARSVLAVAGFGPDAPHLAEPGDEAYEITMNRKERAEA